LHVSRASVLGVEDNKVGEVFVLRTETVGQPGTERGLAILLVTGVAKLIRGLMVDRFGIHRFDDRDVIRHLGGVREEFGNPGAGFAVLFEFEDRGGKGEFGLF